MIFFIASTEALLVHEAADRLRGGFRLKYGKDGVREHVLDEPKVGDIQRMMRSGGLFSAKEMIVVSALFSLLKKAELGQIEDLLPQWQESDHVLVWQEVLPMDRQEQKKLTSSKLWKSLSTFPQATILDAPTGTSVRTWLLQRAKKVGFTLSPQVSAELISLTGGDLYALSQAIDQLAHVTTTGVIEAEHLMLLQSLQENVDIFALIDAVGTRRWDVARDLAVRAVESGTDTHEIISRLQKHIGYIAAVVLEGADSATLQRQRVHAFVAQKVMSQARGWSGDEVIRMIDRLATAEIAIKGSGLPDTVVLTEVFL
jgi:DNA polymerase III delta subunit